MAAIHDLLKQIPDKRLRERIAREWDAATRHKKFGLVYERHIPELVPLWSALPRRGDLVALRAGKLTDTWRVRKIDGTTARLGRRSLSGQSEGVTDRTSVPLADLLVVKQFGEPVFPTLIPVDSIQNGPSNAPRHVLIEADNYHALQLLEYTCAGLVDCIYIDPPYNSGARDWKYNNDYVDSNDEWRHSKWLAFMERRLVIAKRLLNPDDSVLIITIDEKEYLHLGMLLERVFPSATVQMVSSLVNPATVARAGSFGRNDEYLFFVMIGKKGPDRLTLPREWVYGKGRTHTGSLRWDLLRRSGSGAFRSDSPGCFYPIYIDPASGTVAHVGSPMPPGQSVAEARPGLTAVLPIRKDGSEGRWQLSPSTLIPRLPQGRIRINRTRKGGYVLYMLADGEYAKIKRGEFEITGKRADGSIEVADIDTSHVVAVPGSQWRIASHDSTQYGSRLVAELLPNRRFPFPKSVYAVRDAIRFFVQRKKNALILDFFAGSGTTLTAVDLINAVDEGNRRCILVTNNEVSPDEASKLSLRGIQPGDPEWERQGICQYITWPRVQYSILGRRDNGQELSGGYLTGRMIDKSYRRNFYYCQFSLPQSFQRPEGDVLAKDQRAETLRQKRMQAFVSIVCGYSRSLITHETRFFISSEHPASVLFDPEAANDWLEALEEQSHIAEFYIVAENEKQFRSLREQVEDNLGEKSVREQERRPMALGFPSSASYFKLDFLEKDRVELGAAFRDVLPLLWMKAGAIGPMPELPEGPLPDWFAPAAAPFAVLLTEARINGLLVD